MKLLILSDIHGRADRARQVIEGHRDAEAVLFLGDGVRDVMALSDLPPRLIPVGVRGNCDGFSFRALSDFPEERMLCFGGVRMLLLHGHTKGVKHGTEAALAYGAERGADLLLYGHTHLAEEGYLPTGTEVGGKALEKPLWYMNPGSLYEGSYGLVTIQRGQILLSNGRV